MRRSECDDSDLYKFLKLLKKSEGISTSCPNEINEQMFVNTIKKSKKRSASSIFSRRTYAVYKYAILNERMLNILLMFYNMILKQIA